MREDERINILTLLLIGVSVVCIIGLLMLYVVGGF
jgi:hypothetical protein